MTLRGRSIFYGWFVVTIRGVFWILVGSFQAMEKIFWLRHTIFKDFAVGEGEGGSILRGWDNIIFFAYKVSPFTRKNHI